jgi:hypothetical protein
MVDESLTAYTKAKSFVASVRPPYLQLSAKQNKQTKSCPRQLSSFSLGLAFREASHRDADTGTGRGRLLSHMYVLLLNKQTLERGQHCTVKIMHLATKFLFCWINTVEHPKIMASVIVAFGFAK